MPPAIPTTLITIHRQDSTKPCIFHLPTEIRYSIYRLIIKDRDHNRSPKSIWAVKNYNWPFSPWARIHSVIRLEFIHVFVQTWKFDLGRCDPALVTSLGVEMIPYMRHWFLASQRQQLFFGKYVVSLLDGHVTLHYKPSARMDINDEGRVEMSLGDWNGNEDLARCFQWSFSRIWFMGKQVDDLLKDRRVEGLSAAELLLLAERWRVIGAKTPVEMQVKAFDQSEFIVWFSELDVDDDMLLEEHDRQVVGVMNINDKLDEGHDKQDDESLKMVDKQLRQHNQ